MGTVVGKLAFSVGTVGSLGVAVVEELEVAMEDSLLVEFGCCCCCCCEGSDCGCECE